MSKPENPSAFPESCTRDGHRGNVEPGMTLRDYFAGQALLYFVGKPAGRLEKEDEVVRRRAVACYAWADAMLKARQS